MRRYIFLPRGYKQSELQCEKAACVTPKEAADIISYSRPVLITGGMLLENSRLVEYAVKLSEHMPVIATGASSKVLVSRGVKPLSCVFTMHHIAQFILDGGWDVTKRFDTAVFLGFRPYYLSRVLSTLKHFSGMTTISLDELYQPNAHYSLTTLAIVIDEDRCSGCGDCVAACKTMSRGAALSVVLGKLVVRPELCIACGMCAEFCSRDAIGLERGERLYYRMLDEIIRLL
ncbi:CO dehydrogenase/acetyl-CoA synthase complex subunit epsilon [Archaeoglobus veneficus]|uniref:CO dehydrogenase/acetyl-CoA synthase complex, epsilon subunit n=1 Tax=Archaeoglobus veneficus (strain DSM 11195 / SNP6) TaxID=693661 RepID=F2KT92_ARCVS|nr:CO dehydrogenase/acetyl-CoA synthase complex subunit epsilon [Archaeoglobus veneficus]AEA47122.1 CO dehydrogenase/acetyl-CoA synthase complex, epsilon subunit [Archaeoglobus veneficus SNP6]